MNKIILILLIVFGLAFTVNGASLQYTDEASFRIEINGFDEEMTLDFESFASGSLILDGETIQNVRFNHVLPDHLIVVTDAEWSGSSGDKVLGVRGDNIFLSGDSMTIEFTEPVNAFGLHIIASPGDVHPDDFQVVTNSGIVKNIQTPDMTLLDGGEAFFIGLVDDGPQPFSSVELISNDANFEFHIDNITTARRLDIDGDGYINENHNGDDCDDTDPDVHPGQTEVEGNGIDDDCVSGTLDVPADIPGGKGGCFISTIGF